MKDSKWPYVAGLMDGEGSIAIYRSEDRWYKRNNTGSNRGYAYGLHVQIVNSSIDIMKWLLGNFGGKFYTRNTNGKDSFKSTKPIHHWALTGKKNREQFLLGVLPYLIIKKEQALLALEFVRLDEVNPEKRKQLCEKCKELNGRKDRYISKWNSPTTNTSESPESGLKIESELHSDMQSDAVVTQAS